MSKRVTIEQIAKECGVTKGLVSRALAGKYNVSDKTRDLINKKAAELGYDFSKLKTNRKNSSRILLVCPTRILFKEDFWSPIIQSISDTLNHSGYSLEYFVYDDLSPDSEMFKRLSKSVYAGYIVMHIDPNQLMDLILQTKKPVILVDPRSFFDKATQVKFSNYDSFYGATEYLISKGHRKIGFYGALAHSASFRERFEGYMAAMDNNTSKGVEVKLALFDNSAKQYADEDVLTNLIQNEKVTALLCANDIIALNAYKTIKRLGLSVPKDISLIGFDNVRDGQTANPPLSTFNIPRAEMGEGIAKYLINSLTQHISIFSQIVVRCEFVERESVASIA